MPIPPVTDPCWLRLAAGELHRLQTDHLPTRMMAERVLNGDGPVGLKASEIFSYFSRWADHLPGELAQICAL